MTSPRSLTLAALAAVALMAGAASANAAGTPRITTKYTYKAEIKGTQTTTWTLNHIGIGPELCDTDQTGQGKETIRFSSKPTTFYTYDGLDQPIFFTRTGKKASTLSMPLGGTINRRGAIDTKPLPADSDCPDGVGGPPPAPDCGTKKIKRLTVKPEYEYKSDRIVLTQDGAARDPFKHCPSGGSTWPYLLRTDGAGRTIAQSLPYKDLFEQGKNILIATGVEKRSTPDLRWTTKLRWELSLTRVRVEKL